MLHDDSEQELFENEKKIIENEKDLHDIKIADTKLKNVSVILSNLLASFKLSEAQPELERMRAQEVFLTGVVTVTGVDFDDDLEQATVASAHRRKVGD